MIKWLQVENFKNLQNIEAEFGRLNVIIGPNGCGKSSLLQAIDFLRAFFFPSIEDYLTERGFEYDDIPNLRQTNKKIRWQLRAELPPDSYGRCGGLYEYTVSARRWRYLGVGEEKLVYSKHGGNGQTLIERKGRKLVVFGSERQTSNISLFGMPRSYMADMDPRQRRSFPEMFHFRDWVSSFRSFLIWDPKVLRVRDRGKHTELGTSGEHLASVLANLRKNNPDKFNKLVDRVKKLFPTVSDITIRGGRGWGWQEILLHEKNGRDIKFNSKQMSDGVLRLLAVSSFLYTEKVPHVLTFEEPENGVHPQLISETVHILRELTLRKPPHKCQVFFTTHSPYVLDEFFKNPDQVYVMERGKPQQGARIHRLSSRSDIDLLKETYDRSLGEAWFEGVIGGTASGR